MWPIFRTDSNNFNFIENHQYTISFDIWADSETSFATKEVFVNTAIRENSGAYHNLDVIKTSKQRLYASFVYKSGESEVLHIYPTLVEGNNYYISNIQVEESQNVTAYEPYYVTSSTTVTQAQNHTLTAKWTSNLGKYVNLGTSILDLQNTTLSDSTHPSADWRVFSQDENGTWLILSDYMPNSAFDVTDAGLEAATGDYATYGVNSSVDRATLVSGLKGEILGKNWNGLLTGSSLLTGTTLADGVKVQGAVDLETWVESWNANSGYTHLYTPVLTGMSDGLDGYYIGNTENTTSYSYNVSNSNNLYFPHTNSISTNHYWLASPSASSDCNSVMGVGADGTLRGGAYNSTNYSVRPAVYIPSNIQFDTSATVWTLDTTSVQNAQQNNIQQNNLLSASPRLNIRALNTLSIKNIEDDSIESAENIENTEENELETEISNNEETNEEITSNNEDVIDEENTQEEAQNVETVDDETNSDEEVNQDEVNSDDDVEAEVTEVTVNNEDELVDAINQAEAGVIIKLDKNVILAKEVVIPTEKEMILDLNGKTITGNLLESVAQNELNNNDVINLNIIKNEGNLTILGNGKITDSVVETNEENQEEVAVVKQTIINNVGIVTFENGTIEALDKNTTCLNNEGIVNLGIEDSEVSTETPEINATILGTTAIKNNENGKINFYDGRILTTSTITNIVTNVLKNYEIYEELNSSIIKATLKLAEGN